MKPIQVHPLSFAAGALALGLAPWLASPAQSTPVRAAGPGGTHALGAQLTPEQLEILSHMSIVHLPDAQGGSVKTIRFTGVNVQLVNGLEATNGFPADPLSEDPAVVVTNGLGNLIVGYNELGNVYRDDRTGSHNVVVGIRNSYTSIGSLTQGLSNVTSGIYASTTGGAANQASGSGASISGGCFGEASGDNASVTGGQLNVASGDFASVTGGQQNVAADDWSSVSGGFASTTAGVNSWATSCQSCP